VKVTKVGENFIVVVENDGAEFKIRLTAYELLSLVEEGIESLVQEANEGEECSFCLEGTCDLENILRGGLKEIHRK
jgi:hypothetical protein